MCNGNPYLACVCTKLAITSGQGGVEGRERLLMVGLPVALLTSRKEQLLLALGCLKICSAVAVVAVGGARGGFWGRLSLSCYCIATDAPVGRCQASLSCQGAVGGHLLGGV